MGEARNQSFGTAATWHLGRPREMQDETRPFKLKRLRHQDQAFAGLTGWLGSCSGFGYRMSIGRQTTGIVPVGDQRPRQAVDDDSRESEHLRRALELERTARARAERATRARDQMLAIVAHDLRNPAQAIMAAASVLARQPLDENSRRALAIVERGAREMERLISDLLDVARIEAGTFALRREVLDVRALLEHTVEMFRTQARAKNVEVRCGAAQDIRSITGDRDRLIQVLSNLLSNALKFSPVGRHVSVLATNDDRAARISVKDSGAGIPENDLPRVFDRFWQAEPASKAGGAGLGLSICRGIVEAHGGRIWAASKVDRGTTFHFTVPFADS